jgi:two-component system sensor histidine kinase YesM
MAQNARDFTDYLYISAIADDLLSENIMQMIDARRVAFRQFSSIMVTHHSFQSMILYKLDDSPIPFEPFAINQTGITSAMSYDNFRKTNFYEEVMKHEYGVWMFLDKEDKVFVGDNHDKVIFIKVLKNSSTYQDIGILVLGIDETKFRETVDLPLTDEAALYLVGSNGHVFTSTDATSIGVNFEDLRREQIHADQWIVSEDISIANGWKTVIVQKKDNLLSQIDDIRYLTLVIALLCLMFGIVLAGIVASAQIKPIGKLLISMKALQKGDFNQKVTFSGKDEIGQLGHGYNIMVQRIKELIDDVYESKIKQRDAELKTLQAQVNPHFLYNTLNTISWTAEQKGQTELSRIVYSLAQVFRLSLSDGKDRIMLNQEIELIKNYLFIQQTRFHPRFEYEIQVDPTLDNTRIPKLLIQPLIENAIIHGIEPLGGNGYLQVDVSHRTDRMIIIVTDNGVGIPPDKLIRLQLALNDHSESVGVA